MCKRRKTIEEKLERIDNNLDEIWKRIKWVEESIGTLQNLYMGLSDDVFDLQTVRANHMNDRIDKLERELNKKVDTQIKD